MILTFLVRIFKHESFNNLHDFIWNFWVGIMCEETMLLSLKLDIFNFLSHFFQPLGIVLCSIFQQFTAPYNH